MSKNPTPRIPSRTTPLQRYFLWGLLLVIAGYILFHYVFISEQERVQRFVRKGAEVVADRSLLRVSDMISVDYSDPMGLDRRSVIDAARRLFESFNPIEVRVVEILFDQNPTEVASEEGQGEQVCRVRVRASVILHQEGGILEIIDDDPDLRHFVALDLVRRRRGWQVRRIEFQNLDLMRYAVEF